MPIQLKTKAGDFFPVKLNSKGHFLFVGDCHAHQGGKSNAQSGNQRCWICTQTAEAWYDELLKPYSPESIKTLGRSWILFSEGSVDDAQAMGVKSLSTLLLYDPGTEVIDALGDDPYFASDYTLHHGKLGIGKQE